MDLLAIMELGGYPNLVPLYQRLGFRVEVVGSQRKARNLLKKQVPGVVIAEYIFQSDFRDRTSNLESLMAALQRHPGVKVIVFYLPEQAEKLAILEARFNLFAKIAFPITAEKVEAALRAATDGSVAEEAP